MNPILQVKLRFTKEKNNKKPGARNLRSNAEVTVEKLDSLCESLQAVKRFYNNTSKIIDKCLIDVEYNDIIAKTNRIQEIIKPKGHTTNECVVGARFSNSPEGEENHIITHYVDIETIDNTIHDIKIAKKALTEKLECKATPHNFNKPENKITFDTYEMSDSKIRGIIVDCSVVNKFAVPKIDEQIDKEEFLVTFYKTEKSISTILGKIGIDNLVYKYSFYGEDTISVDKNLYKLIEEKVPYMISMVSSDLSKISLEEITKKKVKEMPEIPLPKNEPTIGVIDTLFDSKVYFSEWVEYIEYLDEVEKNLIHEEDKIHGTEVSSLIVDGPRLNPWLEDGCGRFRVRHFGVCTDRISTARLVRKIKEIVNKNPDIHVWNLSLGTEEEVSKNFISFDAAALDTLQAQKNVIFVVSGTNDPNNQGQYKKVGSPADSLNSIVVNSVKRNGKPASYTRKGNILSFYNKPDISYYGGDYDERITVYSPNGEELECGTSFAAPWISRKLCYLIDVLGQPREIAKAIIIDSAAGWEFKKEANKYQPLIGYGVVPIDIKKIMSSESDEIKFTLYGTSESYKTTNYSIPVPKDSDNKYPFIARAMLCYFPECSRAQGVDYTSRELSIKFGRVNNKGVIDDINENAQDEEGFFVNERKSRKAFRKWENTKFISKIDEKKQPLKSYEDRLWGFSITSAERLSSRTNSPLNFGVVITLKELKGINRIDDFVKACLLRGWIVNEISIENQVKVFNSNQEEIVFEE